MHRSLHAETALGDHQAGIYDIGEVISAGGREILHPGIGSLEQSRVFRFPRGKFAYGRKRSVFLLRCVRDCDTTTMIDARTHAHVDKD